MTTTIRRLPITHDTTSARINFLQNAVQAVVWAKRSWETRAAATQSTIETRPLRWDIVLKRSRGQSNPFVRRSRKAKKTRAQGIPSNFLWARMQQRNQTENVLIPDTTDWITCSQHIQISNTDDSGACSLRSDSCGEGASRSKGEASPAATSQSWRSETCSSTRRSVQCRRWRHHGA